MMELELAGRRALVTGASRGLGRTVALKLAKAGASVAAVARSQQSLNSLLAEMGGPAAGHYCLAVDLMESGAPTDLARRISANFGPVELAVHNLGGTLGIRSPFATADEWQRVWRFNLGIAAEFNAVLVPTMQELRQGRIVHVSSIAAVRGPASVPYAAVKAALNSYVARLGQIVAPDGVIISAVMPGPLLTGAGHWDTVTHENPQRAQAFIAQFLPLGRFGTAPEVADLVLFLCTKTATLFAGAVIAVDGGVK